MKRREFIRRGSAVLAATALSSCDTRPRWSDLRLVVGSDATELEFAACEDARSLFEQATGKAPPIVEDTVAFGRFDILVGTAESSYGSSGISNAHVPAVAGGFRVRTGDRPKVVIAGHDAEGARNGLYAFMEHLGFRFFRDRDAIPVGVVLERLPGAWVGERRSQAAFRRCRDVRAGDARSRSRGDRRRCAYRNR